MKTIGKSLNSFMHSVFRHGRKSALHPEAESGSVSTGCIDNLIGFDRIRDDDRHLPWTSAREGQNFKSPDAE
jgi:hypothetical protein